MTLQRRQFLQLAGAAGAALAAPILPRIALALDYPARPVHIVVGFPAGGVTDLGARLMGQWLSDRLGQPFVIDNKPGASTQIAAEAVVQALPDGYTLLMASSTNAINVALYDRHSYDFVGDIAPVAGIMQFPLVLETHPSLPFKTAAELIAYASHHPGQMNLASFGTGTGSHLAGEMFKMMAGIDMLHVPYRGSAPMLVDLLGGQVQVAFDNLPSSIEYIRAGKLRPLAVTTAMRLQALPQVPTLSETLPGYQASAWIGLGAPANTPADIIGRLNAEINAGLADPDISAKAANLSAVVLPGTPADFGKLIAEDVAKWTKVIRVAKIRPEQS
ncbi:MAG TPA: tripartite tricarboxylate transporter substrate binding protein [Xanthobacteraceae bacterium]|nr:tripartite tricarboxylate transporter substrate binding protein [Xanthobacteraceae bacterium]